MVLTELPEPRLTCHNLEPAQFTRTVVDDAHEGLLERPRSIPPKYFYDDLGSRLFEKICKTPEYYPSRCEAALLKRHAAQIIEVANPAHLIELGSGSSRKTRHLLDACQQLNQTPDYWPLDVAESMLITSGASLTREYPWLQVHALVGDYLEAMEQLPLPSAGARLFVFLGGTIGNFPRAHGHAFIAEIAALMRPGDHLLIGVDRVKESEVLTAAYNDASGATAEFNLNMLAVLNRELQADFDSGLFRHQAIYDAEQQRIEMYLIACERQAVNLGLLERHIEIDRDERILTEISRKFRPADIDAMLAQAGLTTRRHFEAKRGYYSLVLATPA